MKSLDNWMEFKDKLTAIKENVDPRYLIEDLGFNINRETSKEIRCSCIIHGGDNKTGFRFNKERRTWACFTHKCHEVHGNDIVSLVMAVKKITFMEAVNYLLDLTGDLNIDIVSYRMRKEKDAFVNRSRKPSVPSSNIVNEESLNQFRNFRSDYFSNSCGFSNETLDFFEIGGGYIDYRKEPRDVIPIRDVNKNLVGYSMRDISGEDIDDKYIHTEDFNKDKVLYNLFNVLPYLGSKPLIVVEGFKSVWRLHEFGIKNSVAVMGSSLTTGQASLLYSYVLHGVVLMFDNDIPGIKGLQTSFNLLKSKISVYPVIITEIDSKGKGLDPSDLSEEQVYSYLNGYI